MLARSKIAMILAEFVGTATLTSVVLAVSKSGIGYPYFVALAVGLVVAGITLSLGAVSGAHLNPAITLGLWTVRKVKTMPAIVYIAAQLLGGAAAYLLFSYFIGQSFKNTGHFESKALVAEAVGAFIFSLGWAAAVYQKMEAGRAAAVVGISLALGVMVASPVLGAGLLNPAVALGVRSWVWASFVLGPILGAVIGFNLYALLFANQETSVSTKSTDKKKK